MKMSLEGRAVIAVTLKNGKRKMLLNFNAGNKDYVGRQINYSRGLKITRHLNEINYESELKNSITSLWRPSYHAELKKVGRAFSI